ELVFKIALESPDPAELVVPNLDPGFASIIARSMIRDVNLRFQNASEFQGAVAEWIATGAGVGTPALPRGGPGPHPSYQGYPGAMPAAVTPHGGVPHQGYAPADASGPYAPMLATSPVPGMHPGMSGSGPYGVSQQSSPHLSGAAQLSASHAGFAMTAPQPRNSGAMIAIGLI